MTSPKSEVHTVRLPKVVSFLLTERHRWKVLYGGRDAMKSHSIARAALIRGVMQPTRFLCARELQTSIDDSIYRLLCDLISEMRLEWAYDIQSKKIFGKPGTQAQGTEFGFEGLRHNIGELKSYEGADVCIVEEAANVSRKSWDTLEPTIRKPDSEIWVAFNPDLETDETYQKFVINPPQDCKCVHLTWRDNPWPSQVLEAGREKMRRERPADYDNIWEGQPRSTLVDAIYADEMMAAQRENRIGVVPYDASSAVHTFWDLGFGNHTSIWIGQKVGVEWRMLKFIEDSNKFLPYYVAELKKLPYVWGTDFLPHDGGAKHLQGDSVQKQLEDLGRKVAVLANEDIDVGINAARSVFPFVFFDRVGCADGLQCLRHYRWKKNSDGIVMSKEPLHDGYSDGADAFRTFAMARAKTSSVTRRSVSTSRTPRMAPAVKGATSWMLG